MKLKIDNQETELPLEHLLNLCREAWTEWIAKNLENHSPWRVRFYYFPGHNEFVIASWPGQAEQPVKMADVDVSRIGWDVNMLYVNMVDQLLKDQIPEHNKFDIVQDSATKCQEFLEWLETNKGCQVEGKSENLMHEFFGVDTKKFDEETEWLLAVLKEREEAYDRKA